MIRENWRVVALVLLLVVSGVALFVPGVGLGSGGDDAADRATNIQYGLDLAGGTRIQAPLQGWTAEGVDIGDRSIPDVEAAVAEELPGGDPSDVTVRFPTERRSQPAIEVTSNVTRQQFASALDANGLSPETIRSGVTAETREETIRVINSKISEAGLSGARAQEVFAAGENRYLIRVEVPEQNASSVIDLVSERGEVRVLAYHPVDRNGSTAFENRTVLRKPDFQEIGIAQVDDRIGPHVPVVIQSEDVDGDGTSEAIEFQRDMVETGIATRGGTSCGWPGGNGPCLLTVVDGEVVYSAGMRDRLGASMVDESWANDPRFVLGTEDLSEAQELAIHLRAGALPAELAIDEGEVQFVAPSQGERFRTFSLVTAVITVLAVAIVVFIRYGDPRVAAPMVVTALSEVAILLGFAAAVGLALDLSHVAGFIAVIGTGVDDLIIIADEVMAEGSVNSGRVFQNRFRKAFWVIGMAAITTVIAMSPLAVLSLGDLQGFAIVTILGVFVGVLITRPAYGDILRNFLTGQ